MEQGAKRLKTNTARGLDDWEPAWLRNLTREQRIALAELLNDIEIEVAAPPKRHCLSAEFHPDQ